MMELHGQLSHVDPGEKSCTVLVGCVVCVSWEDSRRGDYVAAGTEWAHLGRQTLCSGTVLLITHVVTKLLCSHGRCGLTLPFGSENIHDCADDIQYSHCQKKCPTDSGMYTEIFWRFRPFIPLS